MSTTINDLPASLMMHIFSFLEREPSSAHKDVCPKWKEITEQKQKFTDFIKYKIERPGPFFFPDKSEYDFIASLLIPEQVTPRLLSKFIRGEAGACCLLKVISLARVITGEQLTDAFDVKCPVSVFTAMLKKMEKVPDSAVVACIRNYPALLPLVMKKTDYTPQQCLDKSLEFNKSASIKLILSQYPTVKVSIYQVLDSLFEDTFETILDHYLKQNGKVSFDNVISASKMINNRLHSSLFLSFEKDSTNFDKKDSTNYDKEVKIAELVAKAYVESHQIATVESLTQDFDVEVFIRTNKYPVMAAKLIQAVENYSQSP